MSDLFFKINGFRRNSDLKQPLRHVDLHADLRHVVEAQDRPSGFDIGEVRGQPRHDQCVKRCGQRCIFEGRPGIAQGYFGKLIGRFGIFGTHGGCDVGGGQLGGPFPLPSSLAECKFRAGDRTFKIVGVQCRNHLSFGNGLAFNDGQAY